MKQISLFLSILVLVSLFAAGCSDNSSNPAPASTITGTSVTSGRVGTDVIIYGKGFGATQGSSYVSFNGVKVTQYALWQDTVIGVKIPNDATPGKLQVFVNGTGSNAIDFKVILEPLLTKIDPCAGFTGDLITITGKNLGATQGSSFFYFGGDPIIVQSWSNTNITFKVPQTTNHSPSVSVTSGDNIPSNSLPFVMASGGNASSNLTGLWTGQQTISGAQYTYYVFLDETGGTVKGNGIKYSVTSSVDEYISFNLLDGSMTGSNITLDGGANGFGNFTGTLSSNKITGKAEGVDVIFTKK